MVTILFGQWAMLFLRRVAQFPTGVRNRSLSSQTSTLADGAVWCGGCLSRPRGLVLPAAD